MTDRVMTDGRLSVLLGTAIVPAALEIVGQVSDEEIGEFYRSAVYDVLCRADTGLWHLSPATIAQMYVDERESGSFEVPEEQS